MFTPLEYAALQTVMLAVERIAGEQGAFVEVNVASSPDGDGGMVLMVDLDGCAPPIVAEGATNDEGGVFAGDPGTGALVSWSTP